MDIMKFCAYNHFLGFIPILIFLARQGLFKEKIETFQLFSLQLWNRFCIYLIFYRNNRQDIDVHFNLIYNRREETFHSKLRSITQYPKQKIRTYAIKSFSRFEQILKDEFYRQ